MIKKQKAFTSSQSKTITIPGIGSIKVEPSAVPSQPSEESDETILKQLEKLARKQIFDSSERTYAC